MPNNKIQTLKGFRDILPEEAIIRQKVVEIVTGVFRSFGFEPLETPTLEYAETLSGKYGPEADKLIYTFNDRGGRKVGLRYDLTVPVCKVLALYQSQIPLPFKRYQIQNTFRAEKPQRGRLREFTQCDIDIFGVKSPLADAEVINVIYRSLKALGFKEFKININSRQVLFSILEKSDITKKDDQLSVLRSIDKLEKIGWEKVEKELAEQKLPKEKIKLISQSIKNAKPDIRLKQIFEILSKNKTPGNFYAFSPTMVRGLDYYTGAIFETYVTKPNIGSVTGGGRYDNLVKQLGGPDLTGTGTTIGLERIIEVIKEQKLWPELKTAAAKVLVTIFSPNFIDFSSDIANKIRGENIPAELYLDPEAKLDKQLKYADKKGIPYAIIIGPDEVKNRTVILKDLVKKEQKVLSSDKVEVAIDNLLRLM